MKRALQTRTHGEITGIKMPCIIVPLDYESIEKLYREDFSDLNCSYYHFNRKLLNKIISDGFFDLLNKKYTLWISDYESQEITDREIIREILNKDLELSRKCWPMNQWWFWNNLKKCLKLAIEKETCIFFFF